MAAPIPRIEAGATKLLSVQYSAAPSTPTLTIYAGSGSSIVVGTGTVVASTSTTFHAPFTFPNSPGMVLAYLWAASFSTGPVFHGGYLHIVKTRT